MASHLGVCIRGTPRAAVLPPHKAKSPLIFSVQPPGPAILAEGRRRRVVQSSRIRVSNGGDSYLDMWKGAVDRERKTIEFNKIVENTAATDDGGGDGDVEESPEVLEKKSSEFQKILQVPAEERDRVQRMQVIDRAAAAIAAARAILSENSPPQKSFSSDSDSYKTQILKAEGDQNVRAMRGGKKSSTSFLAESGTAQQEAPGPNFWSWTPPPDNDRISDDAESILKLPKEAYPYPANTPVIEKEQSIDNLSIPFESKLFESSRNAPLPPLQSLMEIENVEVSTTSTERLLEEKRELGALFSAHAAEVAHALDKEDEALSRGVNPDGSRRWKEQGVQRRPDGVVCRWTLTRGVSADKSVEWEEKYWEAADQFDHKELGSEKSGRDAAGNVWREFWKETMWQERGLVHLEKTADKWGKNGKGDEWQEKWWERYDASGKAEKWAHKWCSIDPKTPVEVGHAHIWHERWGEKYDGYGGSMKYTDKWAERSEGDGWTKWGDKWDEHFDQNGQGVKQGETWWEGKYGERWNRTWGERHNGSGWVHKYGRSSSGEHWDTHVEQDTWFERYPHYGFQHCFDNSVQLREVRKPSERS